MSKNESDLEYGPCLTCGEDGEEEAAKLGYYFWENEQYWFVECGFCGYRTNEWGEANLAIDEWNGEEYEEDEDDEEDDEMLASVIRMLERERLDNDELRTLHGQQLVELAEEQETCETLRRLLKEAQDNVGDAPALKLRINNLEMKVKNLDHELALKTEHHENQKAAWKKAHAEIMQLRIEASDAKTELSNVRCNHYDVLYVIDKTLSGMTQTAYVKDLLGLMRDGEWRNNDPAENNNSHDTPLDEILYRSSPYHSEHNQEVYDFAITCLGQRPEVFPMELDGLVMEKYVQSSRMHQLAWNAAGRPGETKHDGRRPRT